MAHVRTATPLDRAGLRFITVLLAATLVGPPLVGALAATFVPPWLAILGVSIVTAIAIWRSASQQALSQLLRTLGTPILAACVVSLVVAAFFNIRVSQFMFDANRGDLSALKRQFFREHSCLSSYTEAARFAPEGRNVYQIELYADVPKPGEFKERYIGPFVVDLYQYPPAFLLLPRTAAAMGLDFFTIRTLWFFVQCALLCCAMILLARWIGGAPGAAALLLVPILWIAPTTRVALQAGNFQLTAFPLAVLAMLAFHRGRHPVGGLALGFAAVSKIFPGVLGVLLIATRFWKAVAWTIAWSAALTALAWMVIGSKPFEDFVTYQLPRIESGEAFFWIEHAGMMPVNQSIYGLVTKLRLLGVPFTGQSAATTASSVYAVLVFMLAAFAGWRLHVLGQTGVPSELLRLRHAQVWLALLSLASFRSPFVPDAYGLVGTLWLLTLIVAERRWPAPVLAAFAVAAVSFCVVLDGGLVPTPVPAWLVLMTLAIQVMAIGLNAGVVFRLPNSRLDPAPTGR